MFSDQINSNQFKSVIFNHIHANAHNANQIHVGHRFDLLVHRQLERKALSRLLQDDVGVVGDHRQDFEHHALGRATLVMLVTGIEKEQKPIQSYTSPRRIAKG